MIILLAKDYYLHAGSSPHATAKAEWTDDQYEIVCFTASSAPPHIK